MLSNSLFSFPGTAVLCCYGGTGGGFRSPIRFVIHAYDDILCSRKYCMFFGTPFHRQRTRSGNGKRLLRGQVLRKLNGPVCVARLECQGRACTIRKAGEIWGHDTRSPLHGRLHALRFERQRERFQPGVLQPYDLGRGYDRRDRKQYLQRRVSHFPNGDLGNRGDDQFTAPRATPHSSVPSKRHTDTTKAQTLDRI